MCMKEKYTKTCKPILERATARELFNIIDNYIQKFELRWNNYVGICTDGAKTMNYIKTRPIKARLFSMLYDEMGADHRTLFFYCESRWLS